MPLTSSDVSTKKPDIKSGCAYSRACDLLKSSFVVLGDFTFKNNGFLINEFCSFSRYLSCILDIKNGLNLVDKFKVNILLFIAKPEESVNE